MLPEQFCWTRYGTEAGEEIDSILERKEQERRSTGGVFLWGIGNSVGPAMRDLVRLEARPMVIFSPMKSRPKAIDVAPRGVLEWTTAHDLDGGEWAIPDGLRVTSRQGSEGGRHKRAHYALVCKSSERLQARSESELVFERLVNLKSLGRLGSSQVTAVVRRLAGRNFAAERRTLYPVAFTAELVFPYFVRLSEPCDASATAPTSRRTVKQAQLAIRLAA